MRLVVDTNIFISAALKEASWPASTVRWIGKYGGLLKTHITEQEVLAVLQRPRIAPKIEPSFLVPYTTDAGGRRAGDNHRTRDRMP